MSDHPGTTPQERFRELHQEGTFLMANVVDLATARALAETGAAGAGIEDWSGDPERGFYDSGLAVAGVRRVSLGSSLFHAQVAPAATLVTGNLVTCERLSDPRALTSRALNPRGT